MSQPGFDRPEIEGVWRMQKVMLACILFVAAIAGCGGGAGDPVPPANPDPPPGVEGLQGASSGTGDGSARQKIGE
jgi:hypothetical protein